MQTIVNTRTAIALCRVSRQASCEDMGAGQTWDGSMKRRAGHVQNRRHPIHHRSEYALTLTDGSGLEKRHPPARAFYR
jgi:hypothetical protein